MGNVLDSDSSSTSDSDTESRIVRTAGDGMESTEQKQSLTSTPGPLGALPMELDSPKVSGSPFPLAMSGIGSSSQFPNQIPLTIQIPTKLGQEILVPTTSATTIGPHESVTKSVEEAMKKFKLDKISPKNLPPLNKLIKLKPTRRKTGLDKDEEYYIDGQNLPTPYSQFTSNLPKPRDPKFVPYEPYKGAVRSIMEQTPASPGSRRASSSSSISSCSQIRSPESATTTGAVGADHNCNFHTHSNSNITLLKERLKISEKDNTELQNENTRLKRMIVDSLSGQIPSQSQSHTNPDDNHSSEEIEVWRSKFLSSCVLVEQLTKENHIIKTKLNQAGELFKDIKHTVSMTPELYEKISGWTRGHQKLESSGYDSYCNYSTRENQNVNVNK